MGCLLLAVANISLWATRDVFSSERFGELVTEGIQSAHGLGALGGLIADQILASKPDISVIAQVAAGEIAACGAIALFATAYWSANKRRDALGFIGLGVVITGVFQLLFFPAIRLAVENNIPDASVRVIVGDVVRVLLRDFRIQTVLLIIIGLVVIGASRLLLKEDTQA